MKRYTVICPFCGKANQDLYLEETHGYMECDACGEVSRHAVVNEEDSRSPVVTFPVLLAGVGA